MLAVPQFREVCLTDQHLCIVMEFARGGDAFEYVLSNKAQVHGEGIPENSARWLFIQLMVAVQFCHELGIANRCGVLPVPRSAGRAWRGAASEGFSLWALSLTGHHLLEMHLHSDL